jgi:hypothetical protein
LIPGTEGVLMSIHGLEAALKNALVIFELTGKNI